MLRYFAIIATVVLPGCCTLFASAQRFQHVELHSTNPDFNKVEETSDSIIRAVDNVRGPGMSWSLFQVPSVFAGYQRKRKINFDIPTLDVAYALSAADSTSIIPKPIIASAGGWLERGRRLRELDRWAVYEGMISDPVNIRYALWKLPEPVKLMRDNFTRASFVTNQDLPEPDAEDAQLSEPNIKKRHWLHKFDAGIQFSQAYLSPNWYQGGNNNLSLLTHIIWNVALNPVFHSNVMLESNLQYKLGLYSTPQDQLHKYSISEDLFEWNFKTGLKAAQKWFYSLTMRFKTQFLNNYIQNEPQMSASFLSPGEFNVGLGMTYSTTNKSKSLVFNASIAPISYNLKTCLNDKVDHVQFSMNPGQKTLSQVGSNGELTLNWKLTSNIQYQSRLFLFSNYRYFTGDWENTISFALNRFLSTQIYAHLRYDTSSDATYNTRWRHWMIKEILSFGFQYTFSTK